MQYLCSLQMRRIGITAMVLTTLLISACVPDPEAVLSANFNASPSSGNAPLAVLFTDSSTLGASGAPITEWAWDFGDPASGVNNVSTAQNPTHVYTAAGNYSVTLTVTTVESSATVTRSNLVVVTFSGIGPTASFTASTTSGAPGTLVGFLSTSTVGSGSGAALSWDFGDPASGADNSSTLLNPTHRYNAVGKFTVSLTITTTVGSHTAVENELITIAIPPAPPTADFEANEVMVAPGTPVQFSDLTVSSSELNSWTWDFGDPTSGTGNSSSVQNPLHTYSNPGIYTVSLTATNVDGSDTEMKTNYVTVVAAPSLGARVGDLLKPFGNITTVAFQLQEEYFNAVETIGEDAANETIDVIMAAAFDSQEDVVNHLRRMDLLSGNAVVLPDSMNPKSKGSLESACNGTTVLHVNGMNVLFTGFLANLSSLAAAISNDPQFAGEDVRVMGIYQRSATDAQLSIFGAVVCPLVGGPAFPRLQAQLQSLCRSGGGALLDLAEAGEQKVKDWATLPDFLDNPSQVFDYDRINSAIVNEVSSDYRNVVVVCHSQGNFFTRDVVNGLGSDTLGNYKDSVAVVQVASPTSTMPQPTVRFDICQDPVPRLSSEFSLATCYPWHMSPGGSFDVASHDFVTSYMATATGATAQPAILRQILDYHLELTNPRGQSDLEVSPLQTDLSQAMTGDEITISIKPPDLGDIAWSAATSDPRIEIDVTEGIIRSGQTPADAAVISVMVTDFSEAFVGEVLIQNACITDDLVAVQIRVQGDELVSIDFDDVEGTGNVPLAGDRYADRGVHISSNNSLTVLAGYDDAASPPNSICGLDASGACAGSVELEFDPPADLVSFYVGDRDRDRRTQFQIEVLDSSGEPLTFINSRIDRRFYTFDFEDIAKVTLFPSEDWENLDSLSFIRRE